MSEQTTVPAEVQAELESLLVSVDTAPSIDAKLDWLRIIWQLGRLYGLAEAMRIRRESDRKLIEQVRREQSDWPIRYAPHSDSSGQATPLVHNGPPTDAMRAQAAEAHAQARVAFLHEQPGPVARAKRLAHDALAKAMSQPTGTLDVEG